MKTLNKSEFPARMGRLVSWAEFRAVIEPYHPKAGKGRHPICRLQEHEQGSTQFSRVNGLLLANLRVARLPVVHRQNVI